VWRGWREEAWRRASTDLAHSLAPISRFGITELAEMLYISRPSLRTALKALSVMGIIQAKLKLAE
jgi:hypothetical protein